MRLSDKISDTVCMCVLNTSISSSGNVTQQDVEERNNKRSL